MSGRSQILPPAPHVEDEMEQDTTEYRVERCGAQSPWQPTQLSGLLEHRDPPITTTTTSTDSNPDTVISSTFVQFRPPVGTYKGKVLCELILPPHRSLLACSNNLLD